MKKPLHVIINGYKVIYNTYWREFQVSHDEIGMCEGFKSAKETLEYCRKG